MGAEPAARVFPAADRELIAGVNATGRPLPEELLHDPVFAAAAGDPAAVAVLGDDYRLTFGELAAEAVELSHRLQLLLESEDRLVAIVMEKGWEQIAAALAILETGRTFLPISASQPDPRIQAILSQAGARIALTQVRAQQADRGWHAGIILLPVSVGPLSGARLPRLARSAAPDDTAYVIYTSGSTGVPKGVTIEHRAAGNTLADLAERWSFCAQDRVLWVSSLEFDLSIFDLFGILGVGGAVVIPPPEGSRTRCGGPRRSTGMG